MSEAGEPDRVRQKQNMDRVPIKLEDQSSATLYEGEGINEKPDGYGKMTYYEKTGAHVEKGTVQKVLFIYQGMWKEGEYHGEGCLYQWDSKCFFKGIFDHGEKKAGIEIFPNGDQYEGTYQGDKDMERFHGKGCMNNNSMGYRYEGDFQYGQRHGHGEEWYKSGAYYHGFFQHNLKHGKGKLVFKDESYYQGDFVAGVPSGFGTFIAYSKERSMSILPIMDASQMIIEKKIVFPDKEEEDDIFGNFYEIKTIMQEGEAGDDKSKDIYYYEGDFVDGHKHGLGRYYEPDGSYYYCQWEFDRKVRDILFYNAQNHKWKIYEFRNENALTIGETYSHPIDIMEKIRILKTDEMGFPDNEKDAYKSKIDECGIAGDQFEDPSFPPIFETILLKEDDLKMMPPIVFQRMSEYEHLKKIKKSHDLFEHPIAPDQIIFNETSDYQLLTALESLCYYPYLLRKTLSVKYDLETLNFFTLRLYIQGRWKEMVMDDYIPFNKLTNQSFLANTVNQEYGWFVIQKAFCKLKGGYFYQRSAQFGHQKLVNEYLQILTGLPSRQISWKSFNLETEEKILKVFHKYETKIRICYIKPEESQPRGIPANYPFMIIDYVKTDEEIPGKPYEYNYLLIKSLNFDLKIPQEPSIEQLFFQQMQIKQMCEKYGSSYESLKDKGMFVIGLKQFIQLFCEVNVLQGYKATHANTHNVKFDITDFINNDHRFYVKFAINLPQKVFINIEQHPQESDQLENQQYFPLRIIMGKKVDLFAKNKAEYQEHKVIDKMYSQLDEKMNSVVIKSPENEQVQQSEQVSNKNESQQQSQLMTPQDGAQSHEQSQQLQSPQSQTKMEESMVSSSRKARREQIQQQFQQQKETKDTNDKNKSIGAMLNAMSSDDKQGMGEDQILNTQQTNDDTYDIQKTKFLPYKYIFGKGQKKTPHIYKSKLLEPGEYIFLIQVEGPIGKENKNLQKISSIPLNFTLTLFAENLIHIQRVLEPENFLKNIYEACIEEAEQNIEKVNKAVFQKTDLSDREKGSNDLIIIQYFLKSEGTFLQQLKNQSFGKTEKKWRQKLYFRTTNMKILDQHDPNKIDMHIFPNQSNLIIIQQIGGHKTYNLEGGEGICIIEKIAKSQLSEDEEEEEKEPEKKFSDLVHGVKKKKQEHIMQDQLEKMEQEQENK